MPKTTLNDAIPGDRAEQLASDLGHEKSRLAIQNVVKEYIGSSEFSDRVVGIQLGTLEADPARNKLKDWVNGLILTVTTSDASNARLEGRINDRIDAKAREHAFASKQFWIPTVIAGIAALAAVAALFKG